MGPFAESLAPMPPLRESRSGNYTERELTPRARAAIRLQATTKTRARDIAVTPCHPSKTPRSHLPFVATEAAVAPSSSPLPDGRRYFTAAPGESRPQSTLKTLESQAAEVRCGASTEPLSLQAHANTWRISTPGAVAQGANPASKATPRRSRDSRFRHSRRGYHISGTNPRSSVPGSRS